MKNKLFVLGMLVTVLALGLVFAGCDPGNGGGNSNVGTLIIKNDVNITITVEIRNAGSAPNGILSGLGEKTILPGEEATWTLGLDTGPDCWWGISVYSGTDTDGTWIYDNGAYDAFWGGGTQRCIFVWEGAPYNTYNLREDD
ncbi:MAG: hypothetical protein LBQ46_06340 [Treponema sp.]|jgi:hypothetical protein|nr:hypothetical protein [Treponema sp.]